MATEQLIDKRAAITELLELGMVMVTLDARADGVDVPGHLRGDAQLRLNLSHRFGLPMDIADWGIHATLTFGGVPYECRLPWQAIYLAVSHANGRSFLFPDDVPPEIVLALANSAESSEGDGPPANKAPAKTARPRLRVVAAEPAAGQTAAQPASGNDTGSGPTRPRPRGKGRRHLRVVK